MLFIFGGYYEVEYELLFDDPAVYANELLLDGIVSSIIVGS